MDVEGFRARILEAGVLDPEGIHYEFVGGKHGQKLHFDRAKPGMPVYDDWVVIGAQKIRQLHPDLQGLIILGVADGTNEVAVDIAEELGSGTIGLQTEKVGPKQVRLNKIARQVIRRLKPRKAVAFEDASTEGTVVLTAVEDAYVLGLEDVSVLTTWQRRRRLELLDKANVVYDAIIDKEIPTYTPEDCRRIGHCAASWKLIRHGQ